MSPLTARAEAEPVRNFHLLGGGVLGLIQNDEGFIQCATAHEGQWGNLDGTLLHQAHGPLGLQHII
jgi:hypothetical protein